MSEGDPPLLADPQGRLSVFLGLLRRVGDSGDGASGLLPVALPTLLGTLQADSVHLVLVDPMTGHPHLVVGCDGDGLHQRDIPVGSAAGRLRWDGSALPARVSPMGEAPAWALELCRATPESPVGWLLHLPVGRGPRPDGSLLIFRSRGPGFAPEELRWAEGIADLMALDRQMRTEREELVRVRSESRSVERISRALSSSLDADRVLDRTLEASLDLLGAQDATVWVVDRGGVRCAAARGPGAPEVGTVRALEEEGLAPVFREGGSVILPEDSSGGPQATVPLKGGDRVLGALQVRLPREGVGVMERQRLLARVADHAAVAYENALLHDALRALSVTDPLTGLYNRRQLDLHLGQEVAAAKRGRPLSVVLMDVDGFKAFNDREGHLAGDAALAAVGRLLADETRAMNLAARYGGDEFIVVLSDTGPEGAAHHVERVMRRLARDPEFRETGLGLTAGCATFTPEMERPEDLIASADRDLYRNKAGPVDGTATTDG